MLLRYCGEEVVLLEVGLTDSYLLRLFDVFFSVFGVHCLDIIVFDDYVEVQGLLVQEGLLLVAAEVLFITF